MLDKIKMVYYNENTEKEHLFFLRKNIISSPFVKQQEDKKMSIGSIITTTLEIAFGLVIIWGFWHEDKFVEFEDKLFSLLKSRRRHSKSAVITPFPKGSEKTYKSC